jgi:phage shock protein A
MLHRPFRLSVSNSEVVAMRKENANLKVELKEMEQDYKELKTVYESEVLMAKKGDSQVHNELREVYDKWSASKARVEQLEEKLNEVTLCHFRRV